MLLFRFISLSLYMPRCGEGEHDFEMAARSASLKSPPPFGLTVYKGVKNVVITRNFSNFVLDHPVATEFYKWLEDAMVPDEMFFQVNNFVQHIFALIVQKRLAL